MLYGRMAERETVERLVREARSGVSGALIVRGEPGIGKTALLNHAAETAGAGDTGNAANAVAAAGAGVGGRGIKVLRGVGVEPEADLPFAGLHLLLRPALGLLDRLPGPQQDALRGAFGLGPARGERLLVGLSVLSLLAEYAGTGGLLCVIDDAQWLDHASAEALLIAARRLDGEGVGLLFAARTPGLPAPGLPELVLGPLDDRAAAELVAGHPPDLAGRVLAEAAGNPLALLELPRSLGTARPGELPLTARLQEAFGRRLTPCPRPAVPCCCWPRRAPASWDRCSPPPARSVSPSRTPSRPRPPAWSRCVTTG
ncbi:ATP-binding protein [Nonomuraea sp. NBC_01738]|uniref:ATP-binding protein n=1 Tax=Nonomuraea sp. NBC_01738 TaxID=2976003 RepID=UPI002E11FBBB|nr:ATP-binding protein [Nonomuraea sp. NBC_01738]